MNKEAAAYTGTPALDVSLAKINNPSVIAWGAISYFIHAMSHNLEGNYYEYVVYHPTLPDNQLRLDNRDSSDKNICKFILQTFVQTFQ